MFGHVGGLTWMTLLNGTTTTNSKDRASWMGVGGRAMRTPARMTVPVNLQQTATQAIQDNRGMTQMGELEEANLVQLENMRLKNELRQASLMLAHSDTTTTRQLFGTVVEQKRSLTEAVEEFEKARTRRTKGQSGGAGSPDRLVRFMTSIGVGERRVDPCDDEEVASFASSFGSSMKRERDVGDGESLESQLAREKQLSAKLLETNDQLRRELESLRRESRDRETNLYLLRKIQKEACESQIGWERDRNEWEMEKQKLLRELTHAHMEREKFKDIAKTLESEGKKMMKTLVKTEQLRLEHEALKTTHASRLASISVLQTAQEELKREVVERRESVEKYRAALRSTKAEQKRSTALVNQQITASFEKQLSEARDAAQQAAEEARDAKRRLLDVLNALAANGITTDHASMLRGTSAGFQQDIRHGSKSPSPGRNAQGHGESPPTCSHAQKHGGTLSAGPKSTMVVTPSSRDTTEHSKRGGRGEMQRTPSPPVKRDARLQTTAGVQSKSDTMLRSTPARRTERDGHRTQPTKFPDSSRSRENVIGIQELGGMFAEALANSVGPGTGEDTFVRQEARMNEEVLDMFTNRINDLEAVFESITGKRS
ncbi:hypothetical protein BJ742DRAFT_200607 [Cladochytrium replicatum]|nr:hypothetical protein BJ742DRAFT_200607 [Cladochytrium replicatum]